LPVADGFEEIRDPFGSVESFESGDDRVDSVFDQLNGSIRVSWSRIDQQSVSGRDESIERIPVGLIVLNGIEVGEVDAFESELCLEGVCDFERTGRVEQLALDGLIRFPSSGDASNDLSVHQVEHGDDLAGHRVDLWCHGVVCCGGGEIEVRWSPTC